jgi:hypothetical protein
VSRRLSVGIIIFGLGIPVSALPLPSLSFSLQSGSNSLYLMCPCVHFLRSFTSGSCILSKNPLHVSTILPCTSTIINILCISLICHPGVFVSLLLSNQNILFTVIPPSTGFITFAKSKPSIIFVVDGSHDETHRIILMCD